MRHAPLPSHLPSPIAHLLWLVRHTVYYQIPCVPPAFIPPSQLERKKKADAVLWCAADRICA